MTRSVQVAIFAAIALLGVALVLIGIVQHYAAQVPLLHLAVYLVVAGAILCCVGLAGLGVLIAVPPPEQ